MFEGLRENLEQWVMARPMALYSSIKYKLEHLPQTNFDLGVTFASAGKLQDAIFRFKIALYLQPDFIRAQYNLGCCYLRLEKRALARQSFVQILKREPNHTEALFMLSAIDPASVSPAQRPTRMPPGMVEEFFNSLAPQYDELETANQYHGGRLCADGIKLLVGEKTGLRIVDLGCGTGLAVRGVRAMAEDITGIDVSPAMAHTARAIRVNDRALFDRVLEEDITKLTIGETVLGEADIILCCNTAQFVGDLQSLLALLGAKLKPGASVLLTIEPFNTPAGFGVNIDTGRFGHHPDALKKIAVASGLSVKNEARIHLYPGIPAQLFVFSKAAA